MVINKQTLSLVKTFELDAGFAFHYGNAWEELNGTIHFDASLYPNLDILHHMSDIMKGEALTPVTGAQTVLFQLLQIQLLPNKL